MPFKCIFWQGELLYVELAELLFCIWRLLIGAEDKSISGALCGALHINNSLCVSHSSSAHFQLQCCSASHGQPLLTILRQIVIISTDVDSYFIGVQTVKILSMSSFRTPLHPGVFKLANSHLGPSALAVWGCFWCIEYQTEIQVKPGCRVKGGAVQRRAAESPHIVTSVKDQTLLRIGSG